MPACQPGPGVPHGRADCSPTPPMAGGHSAGPVGSLWSPSRAPAHRPPSRVRGPQEFARLLPIATSGSGKVSFPAVLTEMQPCLRRPLRRNPVWSLGEKPRHCTPQAPQIRLALPPLQSGSRALLHADHRRDHPQLPSSLPQSSAPATQGTTCNPLNLLDPLSLLLDFPCLEGLPRTCPITSQGMHPAPV